MKKLISFFMAIISVLSVFTFSSCYDNGNKCAVCTSFGEETVYKEQNKVISIGKACLNCGTVKADTTLTADYVVSKSNDVTMAQLDADEKGIDCTILLKAGVYENVWFVARGSGSTHLIFETGVEATVVNVEADTYDVTLENAHFYCEPGIGTAGGVQFGTSGKLDDDGERSYMKVTIKNCTFYGETNIARTWAPGLVEDMVVENCTFTNSVNARSSVFTPIFCAEIGGNTVIRNCTFNGAEYGMIRFGHYYDRGVTGTLLIENNVFINSMDARAECQPIMIHAQDGLTVTVKNNVFDDDGVGCFFTYKKENENYADSPFVADPSTITYIVGPNKWQKIPETINNATTYNPLEQELI